jgi:hypothetical protein
LPMVPIGSQLATADDARTPPWQPRAHGIFNLRS